MLDIILLIHWRDKALDREQQDVLTASGITLVSIVGGHTLYWLAVVLQTQKQTTGGTITGRINVVGVEEFDRKVWGSAWVDPEHTLNPTGSVTVLLPFTAFDWNAHGLQLTKTVEISHGKSDFIWSTTCTKFC